MNVCCSEIEIDKNTIIRGFSNKIKVKRNVKEITIVGIRNEIILFNKKTKVNIKGIDNIIQHRKV